MSSPSTPLARRTAKGVVVDEQLVRIACRWTDLTSRDGERFDVSWAGQVGCVDTPADRQLLAERLLTPDAPTLGVAAITRLFVDEGRASLARFVATSESADLLGGERDEGLRQTIEADARRGGFAAGLRIAGPFTLTVDSPSVRRARDAARARRELDSIGVADASRAAGVAELADALKSPGDGASRAIYAARHVDPLDVLRAVAIADARWAMATPTLWIVAGDQLVGVDPTRPDLDRPPINVAAIGPLRSVRGTVEDGRTRLLVGGRGGVAIVDPTTGRATTFRYPADGDVGFNAACIVASSRTLLATHSVHGVVRWSLDEPAMPGRKMEIGGRGARSIIASDANEATLLDDAGRRYRFRDDAISAMDAEGPSVVDLASDRFGHLVMIDAERNLTDDAGDGRAMRTRVSAGVGGVAAIDLCGVSRAIVALVDGTIAIVDVEAGITTPLAGTRWPARAIRARPGVVALLSVDRQRVALIDLARPDAIAAELHVAAVLDRRAADLCFA